MLRLTMLMFSILSTTLMGVGVIIALTTGYDTLTPILVAAGTGLVLSVPASWLVARQLV